MAYTTLISPDQLATERTPSWVVIDCRFDLGDTSAGREAYERGHVPGAFYAHLDEDLSGHISAGITGRHPLPDSVAFLNLMGGWGLRPAAQLVGYDDGPGAIAARLWWLARHCGHERVAVLDGGIAAWGRGGHPVDALIPTPGEGHYPPLPSLAPTVEAAALRTDEWIAVDARAADRFAGLEEPIDPVAGHIPGARSRPFRENLTPEGTFLPAEALRARFEPLGRPHRQVHYCGSGVTAAHNLLAMEIAGLSGARMYPGSWSEWITDPGRPVETGD